ncbi:MAG TPA: hypothetical protein VN577_05320 [Terriglobales bacterium]|nr:hypothetical protein [Terriglobales bacterium]
MARKPPVSVLIVSCMFIVAGVVGLFYHFGDWRTPNIPMGEFIWAMVLRFVAVVCGVYILRARDWARWLAICWMLYHVALSTLHSWSETIIHLLLLAAIAYGLFRPRAGEFFHGNRPAKPPVAA